MGKTQSTSNRNKIFICKQKVAHFNKILTIYLNPNDFPDAGLIVVSTNKLEYYSPISGLLNSSLTIPITTSKFNRKAGNILAVASMNKLKIFSVNTNFYLVSEFDLVNNLNLKINSSAYLTSLDFSISEFIIVSFSSKDVVKLILNSKELINLNLKDQEIAVDEKKFCEKKFQRIPNVFSTVDKVEEIKKDFSQFIFSSIIYKLLISVEKNIFVKSNFSIYNKQFLDESSDNSFTIELYDLRKNCYLSRYGLIKAKRLIQAYFDDENTLFILKENEINCESVFSLEEIKITNIYFEPNIIELNRYLEKEEMFTSLEVTLLKEKNKKLLTKTIFLGTSKGKINIFHKKSDDNSMSLLKIINLNDYCTKNHLDRKVEFMYYDIYFEAMFLSDSRNNFFIIEKLKELEVEEKNELPLFSISEELITTIKQEDIPASKMPIISVDHDILTDRHVILFNKGVKPKITIFNSIDLEFWIGDKP